MLKKKRSYIWWILAIIVIGGGSAYLLMKKNKAGKDLQAKVRTATVKRRDISTKVLATGIIKPKVGAEVKVGSSVSGIVKKLYVNIGDEVKKGQLLAEIDPAEYQAQYNQADASLQNAKASLKSGHANLKSIEANLNFLKVSMQRMEKLLEKNYASQSEYDQTEASYLQVLAQVEQQKALIKQQEAFVAQQKANRDFVATKLGYTKITAPISGVVASVATQEGETVAASFAAPTFVTILDLDRLEIWTYIDETDIGRIEQGQKATFTVDTYSETIFDGEVTRIYPQAEIKDNVVNYLALVEIIDKQDKILRPEMTSTVNIHLEKKEQVLVVPNRAVVKIEGEKMVQQQLDETLEFRKVTTGVRDKYYTEIISGLQEGDRIVTNPKKP
ncbi:MAG: efflux RND transporter periplasmic adaptor subunit [Bacteroidetes bacterium]|nr:MAG: efflux RND transporter periplasmic adaptor subunit [Bacteroidota bacterium]